MIDRGAAEPMGRRLLRLSDRLFRWWHRLEDEKVDRGRFRAAMSRLRREFQAALHDGTRCACKTTGGSCAEILRVEESLWTFARVEGIPPTNNAAGAALAGYARDLASDQRGYCQRAGEPVRGADVDGGGDVPAARAQRPGLLDRVLPSRSERPCNPLALADDGTSDQSRLIPATPPYEPLPRRGRAVSRR